MKAEAVFVRIDRHGADLQFIRGPQDADCDFSAVQGQQLFYGISRSGFQSFSLLFLGACNNLEKRCGGSAHKITRSRRAGLHHGRKFATWGRPAMYSAILWTASENCYQLRRYVVNVNFQASKKVIGKAGCR
jgi:hypothetical protein